MATLATGTWGGGVRVTTRFGAWLAVLVLAAVAAAGYAAATPRFDAPDGWRVFWFVLMGLAGAASVFLFPNARARKATLTAIFVPAVVLRLILLPAAPSDDVNRYLWEGKLVREGVSPYAQVADAPALSYLRDDYWMGMNHRDKPTAYPPAAELGFALIGGVAYHPMSYKVAFVLLDLLTLAGILLLLDRRGLSLAYSGFYALNPIVLVAFAGEGHFDALMLAPLVWALWMSTEGRPRCGVALAALAGGVKWVMLPLLPFFTARRPVVCLAIAIVALAAPALVFAATLPGLWRGLLAFGGAGDFNGPVFDMLHYGFGFSRSVTLAFAGLAFLLVLLWRWRLRGTVAPDSHFRWIIGALIVLSPTVHFWYIAWILPFVCLRPAFPWLSFTVSGAAYFFVWTNAAAGEWGLYAWQKSLFWGPFFLALFYELWSTKGRVPLPLGRCPRGSEREEAVSIVVPTLNAAGAELSRALESIRAQVVAPCEVIIVDAGSQGGQPEGVQEPRPPVRVLSSAPGRGLQIARGLEAARGDWVIVLHADSVLLPDSVAQLLRAVARMPCVVGGAFGQRFRERTPGLLLIEALNDFRALLSRTAFGDQVQFFHRETTLRCELMPKQPLMEDVESSWRVREHGSFLFLGQPCPASHGKWKPGEWTDRVRLVMKLITRYRWARLKDRALAKELSYGMYREYYGQALTRPDLPSEAKSFEDL
ncbi:MAG: glycosyltransferase [Opitutales bacterium]